MRLFTYIILFSFTLSVYSQSVYREFNTKLITEEDNEIIFFKKEKSFLFFKKLDSLLFEGKGNINIMHIGGSHVQAGTLTHAVRTNLLSTYPHIVGDRGLLFPYTAAKTNNPYNYKTTYNGKWLAYRNVHKNLPHLLGLTGMLIVSQDEEAAIHIQMRNNVDVFFDFDRIRLLGYSDSGYVTPILQTLSDSIQGEYDSISKSYLFVLSEPTDSFTIRFAQVVDTLWEPFYVRGVIVENQLPGISYHAIGVNGASVPSYLKCELFEDDLTLINPDLCVFAIGINDASGDNFDTLVFKQNYEALIEKIQNINPDCEFIFITNNDSYRRIKRRYYNNTNGALAKDVFYRLAEKHEGGVWDLFSLMGGLTSMKTWEKEGLSKADKVHFTPAGYTLLGDLFYNALMKAYLEYLRENQQNYGN